LFQHHLIIFFGWHITCFTIREWVILMAALVAIIFFGTTTCLLGLEEIRGWLSLHGYQQLVLVQGFSESNCGHWASYCCHQNSFCWHKLA
jgi:hypothetical protein